jgi:hypothetical protein
MNFDTTNGQIFPRVVGIKIGFDPNGNAWAEYEERMAAVVDGQLVILDTPATCHRIEVAADEMQDPVAMVNPVTGASLGQTTSGQQLYLILMAFIRKNQIAFHGVT